MQIGSLLRLETSALRYATIPGRLTATWDLTHRKCIQIMLGLLVIICRSGRERGESRSWEERVGGNILPENMNFCPRRQATWDANDDNDGRADGGNKF
jgi:hypothetical protein